MVMSPAASLPGQDNGSLIGEADLLPRHPVFRARDLEPAREYLSGVLAPHRLAYLTREHRLNFRHRRAKLGAVELNALQFGGDVMVTAPHIPDYFLLQFTLAGSCTLAQGGRTYDMRAGSVAVINPCRPFTKSWSPDGRQLLIRMDRSLLEREMLAWTGRDPREPIEFDQSQAFAMEKVATLTHAVRMLCDDLRGESSGLDHPLVRDRVASTLASALLVGMPHNYSRAFEARESSIAPASVRRAERFIEDNAENAIGLADVATAAGVSARSLQLAFRRFRDTTPMAHLRALRLELARSELARAGQDGGSVTSVANAHGFGSVSRFAADYKTRFHEQPSETLRRGAAGR
jgi:AraC-like DNA-binding protein